MEQTGPHLQGLSEFEHPLCFSKPTLRKVFRYLPTIPTSLILSFHFFFFFKKVEGKKKKSLFL